MREWTSALSLPASTYSSRCRQLTSSYRSRFRSWSCRFGVPTGSLHSVFKWLTLSLFAYVASALLARPEWADVLRGSLIPTLRLDTAFLATLVAILGTTISPYLFFWQASQEVEEELAQGRRRIGQRRGATDHELSDAAWDVNAGMLFSNVVMYFIILASAATLHQAGRTDIQTAAEAAEALRPLAGNAATVLMALGLIGTGVLAVPILTGSSLRRLRSVRAAAGPG